MKKMVQLPKQLPNSKNAPEHNEVDQRTVAKYHTLKENVQATAYLSEHIVIYIHSGRLVIRNAAHEVTVRQGESVIIRQGTYFEYLKFGGIIEEGYESIIFYLKKELVNEFMHTNPLKIPSQPDSLAAFFKMSSSPIIQGFAFSLIPYCQSSMGDKKEILRLKTFELLFSLSELHPESLAYIYYAPNPLKTDLVQIMEQNFTRNISLEEFADLSGRSPATFKRDFQKVFQTSPFKWLKQRRLLLAHSLMQNANKRPSDVYLEVGFEDYAHFSKSFKAQFGVSPSALR